MSKDSGEIQASLFFLAHICINVLPYPCSHRVFLLYDSDVVYNQSAYFVELLWSHSFDARNGYANLYGASHARGYGVNIFPRLQLDLHTCP